MNATRTAAAATAVILEGATLASFGRHASEAVAQEGAAIEATHAAGLAYWTAAREAFALTSTRTESVRSLMDVSGLSKNDVHALTRLGRVAAVVDGMPSGADAFSCLLLARSMDGRYVAPFDAVAAMEDLTADTVAATLTAALAAAAKDRAKDKAAKDKAAKSEAVSSDDQTTDDATDEGAPEDVEDVTPDAHALAARVIADVEALTAALANGAEYSDTARLNVARALKGYTEALKSREIDAA